MGRIPFVIHLICKNISLHHTCLPSSCICHSLVNILFLRMPTFQPILKKHWPLMNAVNNLSNFIVIVQIAFSSQQYLVRSIFLLSAWHNWPDMSHQQKTMQYDAGWTSALCWLTTWRRKVIWRWWLVDDGDDNSQVVCIDHPFLSCCKQAPCFSFLVYEVNFFLLITCIESPCRPSFFISF